MKKFPPAAEGKGLVHKQGWSKLFVDFVKSGGSNVRCEQRSTTDQIQDLKQSRFPRSRRSNHGKIRGNSQGVDEPRAHDKCRDQTRVVCTDVDASKDEGCNSAQELGR